MDAYRWLFPLVRCLPVEIAHHLGHWTLRLPLPWGGAPCRDPFEWRGLRFPNRIGIAAGFDKDAQVLAGIARLGVGFVEVGTVLNTPWPGNPPPRVRRLEAEHAIWNRLGFPSQGVAKVAPRMARFRRRQRGGMLLASNVAPHSRTVKSGDADRVARGREELLTLVHTLHAHSDFFVVNLSSPNTPGLRDLLYGPGFCDEWVAPVRARLAELDRAAGRHPGTPLLVKLPPEDPEGRPWTDESLAPCVAPFCAPDACDGFVAVNTSVGLARARGVSPDPALPGGLSGAPLRPLAEATLRLLDGMRREEQLLIGVGGVDRPEDALRLREAGADLVELYSGMIYRGPGLPAACARRMAREGARPGASRPS